MTSPIDFTLGAMETVSVSVTVSEDEDEDEGKGEGTHPVRVLI